MDFTAKKSLKQSHLVSLSLKNKPFLKFFRLKSKKYPEEFEKLFAVFEDEALNSQISPSLLSTYLKKRLGYSDASESTQTEVDTDKIKLIFDHDIFVDGE